MDIHPLPEIVLGSTCDIKSHFLYNVDVIKVKHISENVLFVCGFLRPAVMLLNV